MQQTELYRLRSILQLYVNNELQILCNKNWRNISWYKIIYVSWNIMFLISSRST
jgi:hypothetical protein